MQETALNQTASPERIIRALIRVISGEAPRCSAGAFLHPDVKIHMDKAAHRGIQLWYKWIYLIRNCGKVRNLQMIPCNIQWDPQDAAIVMLTMRWSGVGRFAHAPRVTSATYHIKYRIEDSCITEIWTSKTNYTFI